MTGWFAQPELPAFSERGRARLSEAMAYAALPGAAFLMAPTGTIAFFSGALVDVDVDAIAKQVAVILPTEEADLVTFEHDGAAVLALKLGGGWNLCVVASLAAASPAIAERTRKVAGVLRLGMARPLGWAAGEPGSGEGGAPAEARVAARRKPN